MNDWREIERQLTDLLTPRRRPVAVAFRPAAPAGVAPFGGRAPSGCSFWRLAAEGRTLPPGVRPRRSVRPAGPGRGSGHHCLTSN